MTIVDFIKYIENKYANLTCKKKNIGRNVYEIEGVNVYAKVSNDGINFWGITKNVIDKLEVDYNTNGTEYVVVLIANSGKMVLSRNDINNILSNKTAATDGDYKILVSDIF